MQGEIPLWSNQLYFEIKDFQNQRMLTRLSTPQGHIILVLYANGTGYQYVMGNCFSLTTAGTLDYLAVARTTLVKTEQLPNKIDIYRGAVRELTSGYRLITKEIRIDTRTNTSLWEEWIQDNTRARAADGSCPLDFSQFHGKIDWGRDSCVSLEDYVTQVGEAVYMNYGKRR